jgi:glycosyltransferase involved in cell wall biosynthesis
MVIPCFNAEKFIGEALDSLLQFKKKELEIFFINDGSTDSTETEVDKFISKNHDLVNVKKFYQENSGVSAARNLGIDNASGKYIGFLDADDLFDSTFYANIINLINNFEEDIIEFGFSSLQGQYSEDKKKFKPLYKFQGKYLIQNVLEDIHASTVWYSPIRIYLFSTHHHLRLILIIILMLFFNFLVT